LRQLSPGKPARRENATSPDIPSFCAGGRTGFIGGQNVTLFLSEPLTTKEGKDMAYDPDKDKLIEQWKCRETGLLVSINRYGDGEPKVQIGPRVLMKKDGTERAPAKAGRLSVEDVLWLYDIIDEVKEKLSAMAKPA
jgi:hypothetical protein